MEYHTFIIKGIRNQELFQQRVGLGFEWIYLLSKKYVKVDNYIIAVS